ncbi:uncharacterized protein N7459_004326 [Penicillium hispanicum]|uniref:uncharacterized protein n=1 Tax=Penicillium hispanicum TaxID=1080232 RepID=UPI002541D8C2|nr:uncharacterized protein N7459_004326 [Penicillium hispanicum]KAJ5584526.1 hypothetical protein N7459_004326 [Penicillium hispanicum]
MAPREELIASADPSVASSPIEKRVAFLQSKNLTQEEVDIAISRAGEDPSAATAATGVASSPSQGHPSQQQVAYRPPPQSPQGYGYPPHGQWQPPPELIQRYISPLIAPPTPPQLEQDKENIDEQFSRAFGLIEQLSADTAALKAAEDARTERLDAALKDVETLVADLKTSSRRRDDETRRISDEVKSLKDAIPKALEGAREGNENRLKELGTELKSLKVLLGNRLGGGAATPVTGRTVGASTPPATPRPVSEDATVSSVPTTNGLNATVASPEQESQSSAATAATTTQTTNSPLSQLGRSASIPAWQMAAANRSKSSSQSSSAPAANDKPAGSTSEQSAPPS